MSSIGRYHTALIGATLAMSLHVYLSYGGVPFFAPIRLFSAVGSGLIFGHVIAWMPIVANRTGRRGRVRRLLGVLAVIGLAMIAYWTHHGLFLANMSLNPLMLLPITFATASGTLLAMIRPRIATTIRLTVTTVAVALTLWASTATAIISPQLYYRQGAEWHTLMIIVSFSVSLSIGLHAFTRR